MVTVCKSTMDYFSKAMCSYGIYIINQNPSLIVRRIFNVLKPDTVSLKKICLCQTVKNDLMATESGT